MCFAVYRVFHNFYISFIRRLRWTGINKEFVVRGATVLKKFWEDIVGACVYRSEDRSDFIERQQIADISALRPNMRWQEMVNASTEDRSTVDSKLDSTYFLVGKWKKYFDTGAKNLEIGQRTAENMKICYQWDLFDKLERSL